MIMTAELNSHQRVSYYTGVKLIRHHQSASTANPNNNSNNTTNNNNNTSSSSNNSTTSPGFYHHHNHYPPQPAPPHHHPSHHHPHPPPQLPSHHPGHFHLPCPTGPPHIQHPGGVLHLNNHHGPQYHQHHNGHHHYGGGSNQATRLYTGSPLIRSTGYHSSSNSASSGGPGGGNVIGNNKRAFKGHHHNKNRHPHHNSHHNGRNGIGNPNHHSHHQNGIIGGSCSSGTSSSSSSNEHLNNLQSPTGSPVTQAKLDPLKLSSSANLNGESSHSSSNNSSPGPHGSPSPSTLSNLSSSSSPRSSDGNKDLDHFYFLDDHWKPASDRGAGIGLGGEVMDISSNNNSVWTNYSCGSPSPPTVTSATSTSLNMMVDQFFADNGNSTNFGMVDVNNNSIGNGDHGMGGGGVILRDLNNNVIGVQQPDFASRSGGNDRFHSSFSGVNCGNLNTSSNGGASGLLNCGTTTKFNGSASSTAATTVVNVETQIGTFNGQRDLEIRLCFIKDDRQAYHQQGIKFGESQEEGVPKYPAEIRMSTDQDTKLITAIGDPFKPSQSSRLGQGEPKSPSSSITLSDNEMDVSAGPAPVGIEMPGKKEVVQQS